MRRLALGALVALASACAATRPQPPGPGALLDGAAPEAAAVEAPAGSPAPEAAGLQVELTGPAADAGAAPGLDGSPAPAGGEALAEVPPQLELRLRVLDAARDRLGARTRLDCSGYVLASLRAAGLVPRLGPARSRSEALYRASREIARPRPGDLVFFHDTYDRDRNGRAGDRFTHVGLVEAVDGDAVTILHRAGRVERIRMDLSRPSDPAANDPVRVARRRDARGTRYLAGELFAAYGELLGEDVTQMLQGGRAPVVRARHPATR